jgi:hypothetical protein
MPFDANPLKIDNIELLARDLEQATDFTLRRYSHSCGTPACIAGHAVLRWPDIQKESPLSAPLQPDFKRFAKRVGLPMAPLRFLCLPKTVDISGCVYSPAAGDSMIPSDHVTGKMAAAALRRLRDTGETYFDSADDQP